MSDAAKAKLAACAGAREQPQDPGRTGDGDPEHEYRAHRTSIWPSWLPAHGEQEARVRRPRSPSCARDVSAMRNSTLQGAYSIIAARALGLDAEADVRLRPRWRRSMRRPSSPTRRQVRSNFISTLGHGDPATIFDRLRGPEFEQVQHDYLGKRSTPRHRNSHRRLLDRADRAWGGGRGTA